jgi:hypothetical protein
MTLNLDILFPDDFRRTVELCLDRDPVRIALDRKVPHAAAVASQVKYLQRARVKLPSYFAARCVLPPIAFEQSSSEATAFRKEYSGRVAVDLTCGLGVDSLSLSRRFERVIALERDPELAAVARENFRRLGAHNIEVVNSSAEDFLLGSGTSADFRVDLIYADPDRRNASGKKLVRVEDCSPDIAAMLPLLGRLSPRLVVKLSPMFDVDEVFRLFGAHTRVEVVSLGGECKEIVACVSGDIPSPVVGAVAIGLGEVEYPFGSGEVVGLGEEIDPGEAEHPLGPGEAELSGGGDAPEPAPAPAPSREFRADYFQFRANDFRYLVVPDVALQKARLARRYFAPRGVWIDSDNGYGFSVEHPEREPSDQPGGFSDEHPERDPADQQADQQGDLMGKVLEIAAIEPFDPKSLRRRLKSGGVKNLNILKREFPLSSADIARQLGVREGGSTTIAFTRAAGRLWQITIA